MFSASCYLEGLCVQALDTESLQTRTAALRREASAAAQQAGKGAGSARQQQSAVKARRRALQGELAAASGKLNLHWLCMSRSSSLRLKLKSLAWSAARSKELAAAVEAAVQVEDFEAADAHSAELDSAQLSVTNLQQVLRGCEDELASLVSSCGVFGHLPCSCACCQMMAEHSMQFVRGMLQADSCCLAPCIAWPPCDHLHAAGGCTDTCSCRAGSGVAAGSSCTGRPTGQLAGTGCS